MNKESLQEQYKDAVRNGEIFNGGTQCDSWDGPCSCGAWHKPTEAATRLEKIRPQRRKGVEPGRPRLRLVK